MDIEVNYKNKNRYKYNSRYPMHQSKFWSGLIWVLSKIMLTGKKYTVEKINMEIVEIHHNRKADAPSGTAKMLFEAVKEARPDLTAHCGRAGEGKRTPGEVGISSLRMGNIVGIHEVHISTGNQTLTLRHEAHDRGMFAEGAVEAAAFLQGKTPGMYTMTDLLEAK